MSDENDAKIYKNPDRNKKETYKKYVPQYQILGIEPEEVKSSVIDNLQITKTQDLPLTNPRAKRLPVRQPYAEVSKNPIGRGKDIVPNIGNNMEHTWSSVDGEIIDDLSVDNTQNIIDNNDYVTDQALNEQAKIDENQTYDGEYFLLVNSEIISIGSFEEIQQEVKEVLFGEHKKFPGQSLPLDDIMVLKKIKIKMGVFLEG